MNRRFSSIKSITHLLILMVMMPSTLALTANSLRLKPEDVISSYRSNRQKLAPLVYGTLGKCVNMPSKATQFCSSSYMIPEVSATMAAGMAHEMNLSMAMIFNTNPTAACRNKVADVACRSAFPKCDSKAKTVSFDVQDGECLRTINECPLAIKLVLQQQRYCDLSIRRTKKLGICVKPKVTALKNCPKSQADVAVPDWLSHDLQFQDNTITVAQAMLIAANVSQECTKQIGYFQCTGQPFCANDKKTVVSYGSKQRCLQAMQCLPPPMRSAPQTYGFCGLFVDETEAEVYTNSASRVMKNSLVVALSSILVSLWGVLPPTD
ncbi:hypothetical protein TrispH2_008348 [Trichoplax sp. H2]|nr:hypothetical protein TrispH2_008348 [Trichoplax sp. H2]|eukprot:RDD39374.1 hypothetical protein TrispH2_008348 [Trichoplax sp. H2]